MKKKLFIIIGSVLALLLVIVIVLPILFKDQIITKVKEEINKNLNAKVDFGSFDLSLIRSFPNFSLELNDFSVVGINEFENDTLTYIKTLDFSIDLMSVINGEQINIGSFSLNEPIINAIVLENGMVNWDIAKPSEEATSVSSEEPTAFKASLKKYEIKNGTVIYDDREGKMYASLVGLNHHGIGDFTQDLFVLKTSTSIKEFTYKDAGVPYLYKVNTSMKADLDMDMVNWKFTFKENEVQLNQLFLGFDGWVAMPNDDIDMDITYFAKKTDFKNILSLIPAVYAKDFETVKTSGKLALNGYAKGKYNDKSLPGFGLNLKVENGMFQYPDLPKAVNNIIIDLKVDNKDGVPDHTIIDLKRFYMEMAENPVDMKMYITTPESDAHIRGEIKGKVILNSIKEIVPLNEGETLNGTIIADVTLDGKMSSVEKEQYDEFNFKGQLSIIDLAYSSKDSPYDMNIGKMYLNFSPQMVELSTFESKIGRSDINASGRIDNFLQFVLKNDTLTGSFKMNSNLMDLNEFMVEETPSAATQDTASGTPMAVIEVPGNINFSLITSINKVLYDKMEIRNVSGGLKIAHQKVAMTNLRMNLLDGEMELNGSYEAKDVKKPSVDFSLNINGFDIQKTAATFNTVEKLAPIAKNCFGKFSANMKFDTKLDDKMEPLLNTLNGGGKLMTKGVVIQNFAPINKLAEAVKMEKYKKLDLNDVNISFEFKDGRVNVNPFDIKIGNSNATISGSTGFDQTINYLWKMDVPSSEFGGAANAAASMLSMLNSAAGTNVSVPERIEFNVLISGTVKDPNVKVNLKEGEGATSVTESIKDKAKEEFDKKKEELEAKAREEAEKLKKQAEDKVKEEAEKLKSEAEKLKKEAEDKAKKEADRLKEEAEKKKKEAEQKAKEEAAKKLKGLLKP